MRIMESMNTENITEGISKGLELWTIVTLYDIGLILLLLAIILHFSSGYFAESLGKFKFRVSKENWSILFFLIRDYSLFAAFGISVVLINPDMFADVKLPMPFFPLATVLLGIALIFKLQGRLYKDPSQERLFTIFLLATAIVQYLGFVLVMEAAPTEWISSGHASEFWMSLRLLRSNLNPALSMWSFVLSFLSLLVIFILMIRAGLKSKKIIDEAKEIQKK